MKKISLFLALILSVTISLAQEKLNIYNSGNVIFDSYVSSIDSIKFDGNVSLLYILENEYQIKFDDIDSITFVYEDPIQPSDTVYIDYKSTYVEVTNGMQSSGVEVVAIGADVVVTANSGLQDIVYYITGQTDDGSLTIASDKRFILTLAGVSITNTAGAAIDVTIDKKVIVNLPDNTVSNLVDGSSGVQKAAFNSKGQIVFTEGNGTLNVTGNTKHGINSDDYIRIESGNINILGAVNDGLHADYFVMETGNVNIISSGDGIDGSTGYININGGYLTIFSVSDDVAAMKCDSTIHINGGEIEITVAGDQSKGMKSDMGIVFNGGSTSIELSGTAVLEASGSGYDPSYCTALKCDAAIAVNAGSLTIESTSSCLGGKGISADGNVTVSGGEITISLAGDGAIYTNSSGTQDSYSSTCIKSDADVVIVGGTLELTNLGTAGKCVSADGNMTIGNEDGTGAVFNITTAGEPILVPVGSGSGKNPSYCTAFKCDNSLTVNGGEITINSTSACKGGKGFSSDGDIVINGGIINITTAGNGATYTNPSNQTDSYTAACIKADANLSILGGNITCSSSGTGGKGINVDGTLVIGVSGASNDDLVLNVETTGERFTVSGGGGGPGGGGDYANPKAIKSQGNLTINSGTITVHCVQSNEGGEGIESKNTLTINGGLIEVTSVYDDCINASSNITINGGTIYCSSGNNDGVDSNGTLFINGGLTIACGSRVPEEGFDCDNNTFKITGGIILGTGGGTSSPTSSVCTQRSAKYTGTAGNAICVKDANSNIILTYQMPSFTGGGSGPGGGSSMVLLFSCPDLVQGQYTLHYGGSISGAEYFHGYYESATYTGGSSISFNASSMYTVINGGW